MDSSVIPPEQLAVQMTVFTVEVYDTFTAASVGFYPITAAGFEHLDGLALGLIAALGSGRSTALDWRQIAEHPYDPAACDLPTLRLVAP